MAGRGSCAGMKSQLIGSPFEEEIVEMIVLLFSIVSEIEGSDFKEIFDDLNIQ